MHPLATRNEFLRLRLRGLSLASIGRQLRVSKPTLIKWDRQSRQQLDSTISADQQCVAREICGTARDDLAQLIRRHHALKQELLSRAFRDIPTPHIETLAGELHQRIQELELALNGPIAASPAANRAPLLTAQASGASPQTSPNTQTPPAQSEPNRT